MSHVHPDAGRVVAGLRALYAPPSWELFSQVRNATGCCNTIRTADAIAAHMFPAGAWRLHGFEVKTSRRDWQRELQQPEKSGPLKLFCSAWYLVVPAPWKNVLLSLSELPDRWGLIEVGTGDPLRIVEAPEREAEEPTPSFLRALLRAAARESLEVEDDGAPLREITRPALSRWHVGLACGHAAVKPLSKTMPRATRCRSCAQGLRADREMVEAAIGEASEAELLAYSVAITARARAVGMCAKVSA